MAAVAVTTAVAAAAVAAATTTAADADQVPALNTKRAASAALQSVEKVAFACEAGFCNKFFATGLPGLIRDMDANPHYKRNCSAA